MFRTITKRLTSLFASRSNEARYNPCVFEVLDGRLLMSVSPLEATVIPVTNSPAINATFPTATTASIKQDIMNDMAARITRDLQTLEKAVGNKMNLASFDALLANELKDIKSTLKLEFAIKGLTLTPSARTSVTKEVHRLVDGELSATYVTNGKYVEVKNALREELLRELSGQQGTTDQGTSPDSSQNPAGWDLPLGKSFVPQAW